MVSVLASSASKRERVSSAHLVLGTRTAIWRHQTRALVTPAGLGMCELVGQKTVIGT